MSIKVFFTAILASLLFVSCSETNTDYESNSSNAASTNEWKTYEVEIEAETNKSADESTTTKAEIPFKITEENIGGKAILYPKLNIVMS